MNIYIHIFIYISIYLSIYLSIGGEKGTGYEAIYGDLGWVSFENRVMEKKTGVCRQGSIAGAGEVARQAWNMQKKRDYHG